MTLLGVGGCPRWYKTNPDAPECGDPRRKAAESGTQRVKGIFVPRSMQNTGRRIKVVFAHQAPPKSFPVGVPVVLRKMIRSALSVLRSSAVITSVGMRCSLVKQACRRRVEVVIKVEDPSFT